MSRTLILLVGSNPLPNYLSACALQPDGVALVYTRQTEDAKDRLQRTLLAELKNATLSDFLVEDATCATDVRRKIDETFGGVAVGEVRLNYTGGTKVMAAHARMAFKEKGGLPAHASYLDEGGPTQAPRLRFDNGRSQVLADFPNVSLTLETILGLHGISYTPRSQREAGPTVEDADAILRAVLEDVSLAECLYRERQRLKELKRPVDAVPQAFEPGKYGLTLSLNSLPTDAHMGRKAFEQWYAFIGGEWLEGWLGQQVQALNLAPASEIVVGVNAQRGNEAANLEVDVAVIRGHRSYFISCTTDRTKQICKSKLFEIAIRSRQLGGDLARGALVCLADDKTVGALQRDIDDVWGATNTTKVFGLSDLKTWSGHGGAVANRSELRTWLES